ncbi:MAG TPA: alpha/beta hydrolase family protein [Tepidisphaeraceae bacterium]|nr:alpha/beta hydrolase family protein [Tepidisphaeraceae bacterium]
MAGKDYRCTWGSILLLAPLICSQVFAQSAAQVEPANYKGTIVLVHGAWGGGWAFREVDRLLSVDGYKVYRPTLTGQGERSHLSSPNIDLSNHIQDVVNLIEWENLHNVILIGHSYGGMVITGVVDRIPNRVKQVIYLDAFAPENGESGEVMRKMAKNPLNLTEKDGFFVPTWLKPDALLPHDVLMPVKTFSEAITLKNQDKARKISTAYILTVDPGKQPEDDPFYSSYQRAGQRGWKTMVMEGDHNVQWSRPKQLVTYLECAAEMKDPKEAGIALPAPEPAPLGAPTVGIAAGKSTYVIVHGAWGGGYAFKTVDELLTGDGHKVYCPTLTGLGEHFNLSNPNIDLSTHIQDVVNVILWEDLHDVVLVGHSYGGMVITGVADRVPERIKHIVYVDAFLPNDGESLNTARGPSPARGPTTARSARRGGGTNVPAGFRAIGNYDPNRPPPHDVPQSEKTFSEVEVLRNQNAVKRIPATYILNTTHADLKPEGAQFYFFYQRAKERGWDMHITQSDHNIQTSHPRDLVTFLEDVK